MSKASAGRLQRKLSVVDSQQKLPQLTDEEKNEIRTLFAEVTAKKIAIADFDALIINAQNEKANLHRSASELRKVVEEKCAAVGLKHGMELGADKSGFVIDLDALVFMRAKQNT